MSSSDHTAGATGQGRKLLSVVVPMFNEEDNVEQILTSIARVVEPLNCDLELLCVDDGSNDGTLDLLTQLEEKHPVRSIALSRNFGKEAALLAGLDAALGDAIIFLDGDLQHPPDLIPKLVEKWNEGYEVVNFTRQGSRDDSLFYRVSAATFYRLFALLGSRDLRGHTDYKLLDRQAADALRLCPERNRFFRGLVSWIGFRSCEVPIAVEARSSGSSKWSLGALISYSVRNIVSYSSYPLYLIAVLGLGVLLLGLLLMVQTMYRYLSGTAVDGFTTVILLVILLSGFIIFSLGVLAIYVAQLFDEVKGRPTYIVRSR